MSIEENSLGTSHPVVGEFLNNLAGLYREQNHYDDAELFYKRSINILEKSLGVDNPKIAISLEGFHYRTVF